MTTNVKKPTKKENFNVILAVLELAEENSFELPEGYSFEGLNECIHKEIALLDKKAESAQKRALDKKAEGDELRSRIYSVLSDTEFMTINDVTAALEDPTVTPSKVTHRLSAMLKLDPPLVEKDMVSVPVPGEEKKTSKKSAYRRLGSMSF